MPRDYVQLLERVQLLAQAQREINRCQQNVARAEDELETASQHLVNLESQVPDAVKAASET